MGIIFNRASGIYEDFQLPGLAHVPPLHNSWARFLQVGPFPFTVTVLQEAVDSPKP